MQTGGVGGLHIFFAWAPKFLQTGGPVLKLLGLLRVLEIEPLGEVDIAVFIVNER